MWQFNLTSYLRGTKVWICCWKVSKNFPFKNRRKKHFETNVSCRSSSPLRKWSLLQNSVARLGYFWKILIAKFPKTVDQISRDFLDHFEKCNNKSINCCGFYLGNFWCKLDYFFPSSGHTGAEQGGRNLFLRLGRWDLKPVDPSCFFERWAGCLFSSSTNDSSKNYRLHRD